MQKTRALLHRALGELIGEKDYDQITVGDILDHANVGRSTFYAHFRDKDELLVSAMHDLLRTAEVPERSRSTSLEERLVGFSLPLLEHIRRHRGSGEASIGEHGRAILHERLRELLVERIVAEADASPARRGARAPRIPRELLARYVASTFVLVLHWWIDAPNYSTSGDADRLFRALVMPTLRAEA